MNYCDFPLSLVNSLQREQRTQKKEWMKKKSTEKKIRMKEKGSAQEIW